MESLKEKLGVQSPAKPVDEDIIYDVVDFEIVTAEADPVLSGAAQTPRELLYAALVQEFGEKAVFADVSAGGTPNADKADFLVRSDGGISVAIFVVSSVEDTAAYQRAVKQCAVWENRGAYSIIFFENDCADPMLVRGWVRAAMEKAARIKSKQ